MKKTRRIRCLKCESLVLPDYCSDTDDEYAVVKLNVNGKRGCVCSACVEKYGSDWGDAEIGDLERKFETRSNSQVSTNTDESDVEKSVSTVEVRAEETKTDVAYDYKHEQEYFEKNYKCLEYSLDSLSNLVKKTVFGQDEAVKKVMYALYLNQLTNMLEEGGVLFDSPNTGGSSGFKRRHVLLIGDTGVGKTLLATTAAKIFGVAYSISNATPLTASGYVGDDVEKILERLYLAADGDIERAENGILILDEIDKKRYESSSSGKDVNGKAVQQELLKILEPSTVWINKHTVPFRTDNLTVIMMGAFVGLSDIAAKRKRTRKIGFSPLADSEDETSNVKMEDLIEYGFIPEFVGRIPCICELNKLTPSVATDIIYSLLEKYDIFFKTKNFEFIFSPLLVQDLAEDIANSPMGARDAEGVLDEIIRPALWVVLQSLPNGICEILDDGSAKIMRYKLKNPKDTEVVTTLPIRECGE